MKIVIPGSWKSVVLACALLGSSVASAATATDDFNRANGVLGGNWTQVSGHSGTLQIVGNQVRPVAGTYGESIYTASTFGAIQFSEVQYVSGLSGGVINLDVRARQYSSISTADMYRGQLNGLTGMWRILRLDNGVETVLAGGSLTAANGDTFYFKADGSVLTLMRNGVTLGTATDSMYSTGDVGLGIYNHVALLVDNWRGGDVDASDTQAPTAPGSPSLTVVSSSQINLSWTASADNVGVASYVVERCQGAGCSNWTQIATPTTNSYSNTGLTASTSYSYRVKALDAASNSSGYSSTASATTSSGGGGGDTVAPTVPGSPSAAAASSTQINLSWSASSDANGVTGYKIERCLGASCSNFAEIATQPGTSLPNSGLLPSTTYRYRVRAYDASGNHSGYSSIASATTDSGVDTTPPGAPSNLQVQPGTTTMTLSWTAATDNVGVTGYRIERCQGAGCTAFVQIATSTTTSYQNTGLFAGVVYGYRVRATDAAGNLGPYSGNGNGVMAECD